MRNYVGEGLMRAIDQRREGGQTACKRVNDPQAGQKGSVGVVNKRGDQKMRGGTPWLWSQWRTKESS